MKYFYGYILKCGDGSFYVGHTDNLERRLTEHKSGQYFGYTSIRLPVEVVLVRSFPTRDEAFTFERGIKNWSRKKKEALIQGDWPATHSHEQREGVGWKQLSGHAKKKFK